MRFIAQGLTLSRNSPQVPLTLPYLGSGSVLTQEYLQVLTHPSAFLIQIHPGIIMSGLHYKVDLIASVKLIPGKA